MKQRKPLSFYFNGIKKVFSNQIIVSLIVLILIVTFIFIGYRVGGTGFGQQTISVKQGQQYQPAKTLWDWMQLLVIPVVLALVAVWFNRIDKKNELNIAQQRFETEQMLAKQRADDERTLAIDNQQEAALQGYLDRMQELLLDKGLRQSKQGNEVRNVARVRTLTMFYQLDTRRTNYMLAFLRESELITADTTTTIISFNRADLRNIDLHGVMLSNIDLSGAKLRGANLNGADLSGANLSGADLGKAALNRVNFSSANLSNANLSKTSLGRANLSKASFSKADLSGIYLGEAGPSDTYLGKNNIGFLVYVGIQSGAYLSGANLSDAFLSEANLNNTYLCKANLSSAYLGYATLSEANLNNTYLCKANLSGTNFSGADLRGAKLDQTSLDKASLTDEQITIINIVTDIDVYDYD